MRYGVIRGIVEAGNCVYCGRHIDDGGHLFLCEECRKKEEKGCLHERLKEVQYERTRTNSRGRHASGKRK